MAVSEQKHGILQKNITRPLIDESVVGAGSITRDVLIVSGSAMVGLLVESITGTLTISVKTYEGDDSSTAFEVLAWNNVSATSSAWSIKKADLCLSRLIITATYTNNCSFVVVAKAVDGGETTEARDVDILTNTSEQFTEIEAVRTLITTTPTLVNTPNTSEYMYIKHIDVNRMIWIGNNNAITAAGADSYPLGAGEVYKLHLKLNDASTIYAVTETGQAYIYVLGGIA